jgi:hypothetical protein
MAGWHFVVPFEQDEIGPDLLRKACSGLRLWSTNALTGPIRPAGRRMGTFHAALATHADHSDRDGRIPSLENAFAEDRSSISASGYHFRSAPRGLDKAFCISPKHEFPISPRLKH